MIIEWLFLVLVGALIGWLASLIMKTDSQQGAILNILIGILGAILGKWLFADLLGFESATAAGDFSVVGILWGVLGAVVLVAILKAFKLLK